MSSRFTCCHGLDIFCMNKMLDRAEANKRSDAPELVESEKGIFCIFDGRYRYVPTMEVLNDHKHLGSIRPVGHSEIESLKIGPYLPRRSFPNDVLSLDHNGYRQYFSRTLFGTGVEFGAGPRPMTLPARCRVRYADIFDADEFAEKSTSMGGKDDTAIFMDIDLQDSMDEMSTIENNSIDFVIGSHVIEHVRSPFRAIDNAYKRLRDGGCMLLVVPDRDRTFDVNRSITTFDHHLADYYLPSRERDLEHFLEGSRIVEGFESDGLKERAFDRWEKRVDTHMHTFTPATFTPIAEWACREIGYSSYELHDGMLHQPSNEFYVLLRK